MKQLYTKLYSRLRALFPRVSRLQPAISAGAAIDTSASGQPMIRGTVQYHKAINVEHATERAKVLHRYAILNAYIDGEPDDAKRYARRMDLQAQRAAALAEIDTEYS